MSEQQKLVIRSSHLALRFYKSDGWNENLLYSYILKGKLKYHRDAEPYWIGEVGTMYDIEMFIKEEIEVYDYNGDLLVDEAKEKYLKEMNW